MLNEIVNIVATHARMIEAILDPSIHLISLSIYDKKLYHWWDDECIFIEFLYSLAHYKIDSLLIIFNKSLPYKMLKNMPPLCHKPMSFIDQDCPGLSN